MSQNPFLVGTLEQPTIVVRTGQDQQNPHIGLLTIDEWTVKCAVGRNGLVEPHLKREGDGKTPRGRYPLRYGFYDPAVFGDEPRSFDFPFLPKPENYRWVEDPDSPFYNQLVFETDETQASRRGERLFDLIIPVGWNDALFSTSFSFLFPQSCFLFELPFAQQVSRLALLLSRGRVQVSKRNPVWSRAHHYGSVSRVPLHEDRGNALPFRPWRCADLPMFR